MLSAINMSYPHLPAIAHGARVFAMNQDAQLTMRIDSETKARLQKVADAAGVQRAEWIRRQVNKAWERMKK